MKKKQKQDATQQTDRVEETNISVQTQDSYLNSKLRREQRKKADGQKKEKERMERERLERLQRDRIEKDRKDREMIEKERQNEIQRYVAMPIPQIRQPVHQDSVK